MNWKQSDSDEKPYSQIGNITATINSGSGFYHSPEVMVVNQWFTSSTSKFVVAKFPE